ncbi:unnamed protein product [Lymnaea stagnalis]|uniref:EF-hand domain-containing protein n=1 Tax=Lymnaea stagnalis TaxID=6523 RepID=A0AAV2HAI3_LYMST
MVAISSMYCLQRVAFLNEMIHAGMEYTYVLLVAMFGLTHQSVKVIPDFLLQGIHTCFKWYDEDRNRLLDMREFFNLILGPNPKTNATLGTFGKRLEHCDAQFGNLAPKFFSVINRNTDSVIDLVEARYVMKQFDTNGDRRVSREEFERYTKTYLLV